MPLDDIKNINYLEIILAEKQCLIIESPRNLNTISLEKLTDVTHIFVHLTCPEKSPNVDKIQ